jgi:3-methylcrotonyl-CoA carboxylase alpha subunit
MFDKVLIANRGEIAVRVIRACRELGLATVAVYSSADRRALHVRLADQAVEVGPAPASESYLSIQRLVAAALQTGAQAVHPGYGFLAENAAFAAAVIRAGLVFIGPPSQAMQAIGDKAAARALLQAHGIPLIPGYQGADDDENLLRAARSIGFPLLVKAAAGGGGKGLRLVHTAADLPEASAAARREALSTFGDGRLLLERYIPHARHIEFQVLADDTGACLHLFERDCSVQRRHQKIIEETPSPLLDPALRSAMGEAAVAVARAAGYRNAGTVEFIVDPESRAFFFLEMNARLQVEHPITELVTGIDLVHWQLRLAAGERLPFTQAELSQRGHAIECRLYAEDPANGFLPTTGRLLQFIPPEGPGVRVDAGLSAGDEISVYYDPLIAKLIVAAESRPVAIRRMQAALRQLVVLGVTTNSPFLQDLLAQPEFAAGLVDTTWVEERFAAWQPSPCPLPPEVLAAAALTQYAAGPDSQPLAPATDPYNPWQSANGFRLGA